MAWIANGEAGSSVRAKLNALMVPIASGAVTSPVEYFDVALPAGYVSFSFTFNDMRYSVPDILSCAFSPDGGATFWCDTVHIDTYDITHAYMDSSSALHESSFQDSLLYFAAVGAVRQDGCAIIHLSADDSPRVLYQTYSSYPNQGTGTQTFVGNGLLFPEATTPPTYVRPNLMRVLPYGLGDCDPPTSGETITAGSWALFGIPTPA